MRPRKALPVALVIAATSTFGLLAAAPAPATAAKTVPLDAFVTKVVIPHLDASSKDAAYP